MPRKEKRDVVRLFVQRLLATVFRRTNYTTTLSIAHSVTCSCGLYPQIILSLSLAIFLFFSPCLSVFLCDRSRRPVCARENSVVTQFPDFLPHVAFRSFRSRNHSPRQISGVRLQYKYIGPERRNCRVPGMCANLAAERL